MPLTRDAIAALAPDQSALSAAAGLLKPGKWPLRAAAGEMVWGECQGSGANPYRVAADMADGGSKCTCPSRKFPCKHGLALMLMAAGEAFTPAEIPDWVMEWQGRRRKTPPPPRMGEARLEDIAALPPPDPEAAAKKREAAAKRASETRRAVQGATVELEVWIADQLASLPAFLAALPERCRRIAARLVDGKAALLASRVDEMPSRLLPLPAPERVDAAIAELGKLVLLVRAWRAAPGDAALRREVIGAESREEVLENPASPRLAASWEVLGDRVTTRRDGLVSVQTWLMTLGDAPVRFALLQDFFPATAGRRSGGFAAGERFDAELVFYPGPVPLRAVIAARQPAVSLTDWPVAGEAWGHVATHLLAAPWALEMPLLLPPGRIAADAQNRFWWQGDDLVLPLEEAAPLAAQGAVFSGAAGIWNGARLALLAGQSIWGRLGFDG
jgi:hypothetical protein